MLQGCLESDKDPCPKTLVNTIYKAHKKSITLIKTIAAQKVVLSAGKVTQKYDFVLSKTMKQTETQNLRFILPLGS